MPASEITPIRRPEKRGRQSAGGSTTVALLSSLGRYFFLYLLSYPELRLGSLIRFLPSGYFRRRESDFVDPGSDIEGIDGSIFRDNGMVRDVMFMIVGGWGCESRAMGVFGSSWVGLVAFGEEGWIGDLWGGFWLYVPRSCGWGWGWKGVDGKGKLRRNYGQGIWDLVNSRSPDLQLLGAMSWSSYIWIKECEQWCFELGDTHGDGFVTVL